MRHGISGEEDYLLVVQHPVTEEMDNAKDQVQVLVNALKQIPMRKVWVLPNNDAGSETVRRELLRQRSIDTAIFENLSRQDYLGLLKGCKAIVGNSSSGILEAPTFQIPAVNLGRRQADRVQGINVINAPFELEHCLQAIKCAISPEFRATLSRCTNPYGDGRSSERILDILSSMSVDSHLLVKKLAY